MSVVGVVVGQLVWDRVGLMVGVMGVVRVMGELWGFSGSGVGDG